MPSKETTITKVKVLIQPTQEATTDASAPQDPTITWSSLYFSSLHIILVYIIPCFDVLYSGIGGIHWSYLIFYFLRSYIDIIFCLNLALFLFPLLTNSFIFIFIFFETCGFSYMTQTPCHSGGTTSSLYFQLIFKHWGQCSAWLGGVEEGSIVYNARL